MIDLLLSAEARPFAIALALFGGLLILELLGLVIGMSFVAFDIDVDLDIEAEAEADGGFLSWLGLGEVPFIIWFASLLVGFGLSGVAVLGLGGAMGLSPPMLLTVPIALVAGLLIAREVGSAILRLIRPEHNAAVSRRRLGGRPGTITQGTAREGAPAEARVRDVHGNLQYVRVTPLPGADPIPQGTEVFVRANRDGTYTAVPLTADTE